MSFTVDDILKAKPSLRDRARAAADERRVQEKRQAEEEQDSLSRDAFDFMVDVLGMNPRDAGEVQLHRGSFSPVRQQVSFKIEGLEFRVRYQLEKIMENKSDQFGSEEAIYDLKPMLEYRSGPNTWKEIKALADLGERI